MSKLKNLNIATTVADNDDWMSLVETYVVQSRLDENYVFHVLSYVIHMLFCISSVPNKCISIYVYFCDLLFGDNSLNTDWAVFVDVQVVDVDLRTQIKIFILFIQL